MTRQSRLAVGWALALVAALLLELTLVRPATAPEVGAATSPAPAAALGDADPIDRLPPFATWPLADDWIAGSARPTELALLGADQAALLQAAVDRARAEFHLDSLVVGVSVPGGRGWTGSSGFAADGRTPLAPNAPFVIASVTKTFTAALVLQLVEERRLSLDAEVADLLPGVAVPAQVTVAQLLRHTSGVADLLKPLRPQLNEETDYRFAPAEVVASVGKPWWPPGTDWGYSNTNYVLLGMVVERVTGQPFAEVLERRLLAPLRLVGSGMLLEPDAPWLMPASWVTAFWTSGSMYATADDLLRWGDALYDGHVLRPGSLRRMLAFDRNRYGLGAEQLTIGDRPAYGHSGLLRGFTTLLVHLPADDVTLVVLSSGPRYDPAQLLADAEEGEDSILEVALAAAGEQP